MPFMDYRLVSYVFGLPAQDKVGLGYTKLILREAMKGIMPESIRRRRSKIGFNAPLSSLFKKELANLYVLVSSTYFWRNNPWWDVKQVDSLVKDRIDNQRWSDQDSSLAADIWLKLNLCMWNMIFIDRTYRV